MGRLAMGSRALGMSRGVEVKVLKDAPGPQRMSAWKPGEGSVAWGMAVLLLLCCLLCCLLCLSLCGRGAAPKLCAVQSMSNVRVTPLETKHGREFGCPRVMAAPAARPSLGWHMSCQHQPQPCSLRINTRTSPEDDLSRAHHVLQLRPLRPPPARDADALHLWVRPALPAPGACWVRAVFVDIAG